MILTPISLLMILTAAAPVSSAASNDIFEPYRILIEANRARDAALAASAYTRDAALIFEYTGMPREEHRGRDTILRNYERTFRSVGALPIDLAFRIDPSKSRPDRQDGVYRVTVGLGAKAIRSYGRFSARLVRENGRWRFAEDRGWEATAADFDRHRGTPIDAD